MVLGLKSTSAKCIIALSVIYYYVDFREGLEFQKKKKGEMRQFIF